MTFDFYSELTEQFRSKNGAIIVAHFVFFLEVDSIFDSYVILK
jgi:hypothetical protein